MTSQPAPYDSPQAAASAPTATESGQTPEGAHSLADEGWTPVPKDEWNPAPKDDPLAAVSDLMLHETKWPSEWHLVCYMAAHGHSQRSIAKELSYSENGISLIMQKREVQDRIERLRKQESANLDRRLTELAPVALDVMSDVVTGKVASRTGEKLDAAKWLLEKKTGKPRTEGAEEQGNVALQILQTLQHMNTQRAAAAGGAVPQGTAGEQAIDVTPHTEDDAERWVRENLTQAAVSAEKESRK